MKSTHATQAPLTFSTETAAHRRKAIRNFALFCLMPAFWVVVCWFMPDVEQNWGWVGLLAFNEVFFISFGLLCTFHPHRGTWRIDDDGLHFEPLHGKSRSMLWRDVERVMWTRQHVILKGSGKKLGLPVAFVDDKDFLAAAHSRIEKHLSPEFDLILKPIERGTDFFELGWRKGLRRFAQLVVIAFVAFAVVVIVYTALALLLLNLIPSLHGDTLFFLVTGLLFVPLLVFVLREHRRHERLNPTWRYRRFD